MDNITHTLTGLILSRMGLDRWCPRAAALLMLASNAPDADIVMRIEDSITYLDYHRHLTHSLALMPVVAILPVLIVRLFSRGPFPYLRSLLVSIIGVLVHLGFGKYDGLLYRGESTEPDTRRVTQVSFYDLNTDITIEAPER